MVALHGIFISKLSYTLLCTFLKERECKEVEPGPVSALFLFVYLSRILLRVVLIGSLTRTGIGIPTLEGLQLEMKIPIFLGYIRMQYSLRTCNFHSLVSNINQLFGAHYFKWGGRQTI